MSTYTLPPTVASEGLVYGVVELDKDHPVPISWDSDDPSTGYARILLDAGSAQILYMEMVVDGTFVDEDNAAQSDNFLNGSNANGIFLQPFHFHNQPQGAPGFFVQQLYDIDPDAADPTAPVTATLENTATGFRFEIDEPYLLRDPVNDPALTADGVIDTIRQNDGTAYLGIHTLALTIPATATAGDIVVLSDGGIDGAIEIFGDDADVASGTGGGDLLSMGGGDDVAMAGAGNDVMDGGAGDDRLEGGGGDDVGWGGDGDDSLTGGHGEDTLSGNRGDDSLSGGAGDDVIDGGDGDDVLTGGGFDRNVFVMTGEAFGDDVITDFDVDGSGRERSRDTLTFTFAGEERSLSTTDDFLAFTRLIETDGTGDTDALIDRRDLVFDFDGASVRLAGVIGRDGLTEERLLEAGADVFGLG